MDLTYNRFHRASDFGPLCKLKIICCLITATALSACGGGGGSGDTPASPATLTYAGNTSPAIITASNAKVLVSSVLGSGETAPNVTIQNVNHASPETGAPATGYNVVGLAKQLKQQLPPAIVRADSSRPVYRPASIPVNEQQPCDSGTLGLTGTLSDVGTGTLNINFSNCSLDGSQFNGTARLIINALDINYELLTDAVLEFDLITVRGGSGNATFTGSMRMQAAVATHTETLTQNLVIRDDDTGRSMKTDNLVLATTYDNLLFPTLFQESINGRLYDLSEGYIDISTSQPMAYSNLSLEYPDMGGVLLITGGNDATILITSVSGSSLQMQVDLDGDGSPEYDNGMLWSVFDESTVPIPSVPVADAGTDQPAPVSSPVTLSSAASFDNNGDLLTHQWEVVSGPAGHTATLTNSTSPSPQFAADLPGIYQIDVTVSDGVNSNVDTVTVTLQATTDQALSTSLVYQVVDAEYSDQLERIVMVSAAPPVIHIYDPATGQEVSVSLPLSPSSVSVAPDGLHAAVGHNGWISYIDIDQGLLEASYPVSTNVLDTVLAGNGYVYAFPAQDQWESIRSIELATGTETLHTGNSIYAGTLARLHPDGSAIYGADNGLSPSDIEKYSITAGNALYLYDSPYHGDYAMCGELWFSEDGNRIFTRCGHVFRSSSVQSQDMIFNGALASIEWIIDLNHSAEAGQLAVIPGSMWGTPDTQDTRLGLFEDQFLGETQSIELPLFSSNGQHYPNHGRFVFFNSDGSVLYVITQADSTAGVTDDHRIIQFAGSPWTLVMGQSSGNTAPVARAGRDQTADLNEQVLLDGAGSFDVDGDTLTLRWSIDASPVGSLPTLVDNGDGTATFMPDVPGAYMLALTVSDNRAVSTDTLSVTAHAGLDILNYQVVDAEYSDQLERIVMVSAAPPVIHIYDPATGQEVSVSLPLPPSSVSVAPDGLHAAVGHNGWISYIDIDQGLLEASYPVSTNVLDTVLAGNGYVYAFPAQDQWESIRSIELATGTETLHTGNSIYAGTLARLHPDGSAIYGADNGLSPSDIEKYSITAGNALYLYDSPYHGDYAMCGELWFSEDGNRSFTRCGNVFRASTVQADDMLYNGSFAEINWISNLNHSAEAGQIVVIPGAMWGVPGTEDTKLHFFEDGFLVETETVDLPLFTSNGQDFPNHGRFVFFGSDGSELYVITQADLSSGALNDYAVVSYERN